MASMSLLAVSWPVPEDRVRGRKASRGASKSHGRIHAALVARGGAAREADLERRSVAVAGRDRDRAAVGTDDLVRDEQTQPEAARGTPFVARALERREDVR